MDVKFVRVRGEEDDSLRSSRDSTEAELGVLPPSSRPGASAASSRGLPYPDCSAPVLRSLRSAFCRFAVRSLAAFAPGRRSLWRTAPHSLYLTLPAHNNLLAKSARADLSPFSSVMCA